MRAATCATLFAFAAALLAPPSGAAQSTRAVPLIGVSPAHCVDALEKRAALDPLRCPLALGRAIADATTTCHEAEGTLAGAREGAVWALDVDGDGRQEMAFELDDNVTCEGAWNVFSCGSHGCPKTLYELRAGAWTAIGNVAAETPEALTVAESAAADGHRTLEVCARERCAERWTYEWVGSKYEATRVEIRGGTVDIAGSIHGLYPLAAATTLRARPAANGAEVGRYDAGTEVTVIGTAEGGDHYYVSPCNACESGFVPRAAVAAP